MGAGMARRHTPLWQYVDARLGGMADVPAISQALGVTRQHVHAMLVDRHPSLRLAIRLYRWSGDDELLRPERWEPWA